MRIIVGSTLLSIAGFLVAGPVWAADTVQPQPGVVTTESGWTFTIAPYVWMAGLEGDIAQFGLPTASVDASFGDILENIDFAFMAVGEARYGKFAFVTDIVYSELSLGGNTPLGILADRLEVTSKLFTALGAGSYRFVENESGHIDALAGARLWKVSTEIDLVNSPLPVTSFEDSDTWVDPIIGVSGRLNLSPEFYLTGWGMIGGFGVASDLTWDVMGGAGYVYSDWITLVAGYRALAVDYEEDSFVFDVVQHGPFVAATFTF